MNLRIWGIILLAAVLAACSHSKEQPATEGASETSTQAVEESESSARSDDGEGHGEEHAEQHENAHDSSEADSSEGEGAHGPRGHRFTKPEQYAKRWNDPARDKWQRPEDVMALLEIEEGMTVADLGTGTGYFVPHLAAAVGPTGKVLALDVEESMIEYVQNQVLEQDMEQVEARVVPYDDPGLSDGSVDRVLTVNTWHHINDRETYARKLATGLAPGGAVAVVDYTRDSDHGPPRDHKLAPQQVVRELEAGGFDARVVDEDLPRQYVVIGRKVAE